jgi:hypothetical protein
MLLHIALCILLSIISVYFFKKTLHEHFYMEDILDGVCARLSNGAMSEYDNGNCITSTCPMEQCMKLVNGNYIQDISKMDFRQSQCVSKTNNINFKECLPYTPPVPTQQPTIQPTIQSATSQPTYQQPTYQQPTYQQPTYQQPTYQQPTYQQPTYHQPTYQQPTYQPTYQQPTSVSASTNIVISNPSTSRVILGNTISTSNTPVCRGSDHCFEYIDSKWTKNIYSNVVDNNTNTCVWMDIKTNDIIDSATLASCLKEPVYCSLQNTTCVSPSDSGVIGGKTIRYSPDSSGDCVAVNSCDSCGDNSTISCYTFNDTNRLYEETIYTETSLLNGSCSFVDEDNVVLGDTCKSEIVLNCRDEFTCNGEVYEPVYNSDGTECEYKSKTSDKVMYSEICPTLQTSCPSNKYFNETNNVCSVCGSDYNLTNRNGKTFEEACKIVDSCRVNYVTCFDEDCKMSIKRKITNASNECVPPSDCDTSCRIPPPPIPVKCSKNPWRRCVNPEDLTAEYYAYDRNDGCKLKSKESDKIIDTCNPRCPPRKRLSRIDGELKCV